MSVPLLEEQSGFARSVTGRAPGKINVSFECGDPREDGFHPVATLYLAVGLDEQVTALYRADGEITAELDDASTIAVDRETFPVGVDNLAVKAALALREATGVRAGADLRILKRVPVAGGMGGGSADAAAALVACNALWGTHLTRQDLASIAARLGSDVPFALYGGAAVGLGRGEDLAPVPLRSESHWVLIPASYGLSTPKVYGELDRQRERAGLSFPAPKEVSPEVLHALLEGDPHKLAASVHNDLTPASIALAPELAHVIERAEDAGALKAIVSGSGPTLACIARSSAHAERISMQVRDELDVQTIVVSAPAAGASIVPHSGSF